MRHFTDRLANVLIHLTACQRREGTSDAGKRSGGMSGWAMLKPKKVDAPPHSTPPKKQQTAKQPTRY